MTNLYEELAHYTGRDLDLVRFRCQYAVYELAWLWSKGPVQIPQFYRDTDLYLYDLTRYQVELTNAGWHEWLARLCKEKELIGVLDYGGGIGEATKTCYNAGCRVNYVDLEGSYQMTYAMTRFRHAEMLGIGMFDASDPIPMGAQYDLIIAMDVLEHLPEPDAKVLIRDFSRMAPYLICNADSLQFNKFFPQHLHQPDLTPHYAKVEGNLWRVHDADVR